MEEAAEVRGKRRWKEYGMEVKKLYAEDDGSVV